ncbi:MAG: 2-amino-4-deoxychorismate dehydrogenase [Alphaproteobacteria bacterium ADurb.Bin438]|nr:MAG: 2-amino-4-deoxychorismate dehydrogenase [Alphaproteobacteria bacterium ADurb.Bin438]
MLPNLVKETEIINVGNKVISGCTTCQECQKNKDGRCSIKNDFVNDAIQKMIEADGIIIASPVFFGGINGTLKSFLDRAFYASYDKFKGKVGASIVSQRRFLVMQAIEQINTFYTISNMLCAGYGFLDTSIRDHMGMKI